MATETSTLCADDLLTEPELAEMLRITPRTQRLYRAEGDCPDYIKIGRKVLYRRSAVLDWLAARERPASGLAPGSSAA